jgi:hypothetical protein
MSMRIDESVKSSNKRVVWKVFDRTPDGKILSFYQSFEYPKGKLIERSRDHDAPSYRRSDGDLIGSEGLHFYSSKAIAVARAKEWHVSYIAKFAVDPADFMFANKDGSELMYERATRVGNYIKVSGKGTASG